MVPTKATLAVSAPVSASASTSGQVTGDLIEILTQAISKLKVNLFNKIQQRTPDVTGRRPISRQRYYYYRERSYILPFCSLYSKYIGEQWFYRVGRFYYIGRVPKHSRPDRKKLIPSELV